MAFSNPASRFSARAAHYDRWRPGYPDAILSLLREQAGLEPGHVVVDLGSGTGISSEFLLRLGCRVIAVEPNEAMREVAELRLSSDPFFRSVNSTAEATGLPGSSVDCLVAATSFHWFDSRQARIEFARILKPGGWVALIWNVRAAGASQFQTSYEAILQRHCPEYAARLAHDRQLPNAGGQAQAVFAPGAYLRQRFRHTQALDWLGLEGRTLSSSYVPLPPDPVNTVLMQDLHSCYEAHQQSGQVAFEYDAEVYLGRLGPV